MSASAYVPAVLMNARFNGGGERGEGGGVEGGEWGGGAGV